MAQPAYDTGTEPPQSDNQYAGYGDPRAAGWEAANLTPIQIGSTKVMVHNSVAGQFSGLAKDLTAAGYQINSVGGHNLRNVTGGTTLSPHAYGLAIDINPTANPYSKNADGGSLTTDMPANVADIAKKWGLEWGGSWNSVKDPMHFELAGARDGGAKSVPEPDFNTKWGLTGQQPKADFGARWGLQPPATAVAPSPATTAPAVSSDFESRWGIKPPANDTKPPASAPATPQLGDPRIAANALGGDQFIPSAAPNALSTGYAAATKALEPPPGFTPSNLFPIARNDTTGGYVPAVPGWMRGTAQGAVDLGFGPALGTVTPAATNALTMMVPGLTPSVAAGSGLAIADLAQARANPLVAAPPVIAAPHPLASPDAPAFMPPGTQSPALARIQQLIEADNQVAANRPGFVPPSTSTDVRGNVAPISQPPNPLTPEPPPVVSQPITAPPALKAPATAADAIAAQEAAETASIPEKLPPAPLIPPLTQGAAETRADQLIKHFHAGNPVVGAPDVVPGYIPKLAGLTNDPGIATLERGVQAANPGAIGVRDQANQAAIATAERKLIGDPENVKIDEAARDAITGPMRETALANAAPVDLAPVLDEARAILSGPEGKRAAVRTNVQKVLASLHEGQNPENPLETTGEMVYGVRKNLNDLLSPVSQKDDPQLQQASRALMQLKGKLDQSLESAAPGMRDYFATHAELSQPIDAQKYLQSLNLTNAAGGVKLNAVDTAIKAVERQQNMPGIQKATWVTPEQLDALKTLRNTLRMDQFSASAGKHLGANTFQNLATNSVAGQVTGSPLVHLALGGVGMAATANPLVAMGAAGINMAAHQTLARSEAMVREAIVKRLLNHQGAGAAALAPPP